MRAARGRALVEVDFFSWLCFVVFLFEGAGGGGFFLVGCVLLFLFLFCCFDRHED